MKLELDKYATAVADVSISRADVQEFTDDVLTFWRTHKSELPMWARSARIVFAMSTNSASCERVFSLLANMFGDNQNSAGRWAIYCRVRSCCATTSVRSADA